MKKSDMWLSTLFIIVFSLILIIPIVRINLVNGKISETENRELANFPELVDENGHLALGLKEGFENWLSDNIGFRSAFVASTAEIKLKLFRQTTSDRVEIGHDGWYFLTDNHNVELAAGDFRFSDEELEQICSNQEKISRWYASQGITYLLVLTAAKTSIYPEYIASSECSLQETLCDQVEEYLRNHSDVRILNTKHILLESKPVGKLYLKTDTHWTQLGSYVVFRAIMEELSACGLKDRPFSVDFSEGTATGEFSAMLGVKGILGEEPVPVAKWAATATTLSNGTVYDTATKLNSANNESKRYPVVMYENASAQNGTLLIYGDSQWMTARNLPQWLGEEFQTVVSTRFRSVSRELDAAVKPQVVIFGCSERLMESILTREPDLPGVSASLPDLPLKELISEEAYGSWIGNQGVCLENVGGVSMKGSTVIPADMQNTTVRLQGWAADFYENRPLRELYLKIGDVILACDYGVERTSIAEYFGNQSLLKIGFKIDLPTQYLRDGEVTEISFYGVSADGQYLYGPAVYTLDY